MHGWIYMRNTTLKSLVSLTLVMLSASVALSAGKAAKKTEEKPALKKIAAKSADLSGTQYCGNELRLNDLMPIPHIDEKNPVDRIVISKKFRKLYLLSQGRLYKTYDVAFGFGFYEGNKVQQGDGRTPEGIYKVELKNDQSAYHQALRVSYPNDRDKAYAAKNEVDPGGDVMIHGFPSAPEKEQQRYALSQTHPSINWTQGCIAVTDKEIEEIFSLVEVNTTIEICPR